MNRFNHNIKGFVLSGTVLALAGCGVMNSGPSSHTVKKLIATRAINKQISIISNDLQMEKFLGASTPTYAKREAILKKLKSNQTRYLHKYENVMHFNGCTKDGEGTYRCSVSFRGTKTRKDESLIAIIDKAGSTWTLGKLQKS